MPEATTTTPVIRVRLAHANSARTGWKLAETTVEISGTNLQEIDQWLTATLYSAHQAGLAESERRNAQEQRTLVKGPGND